MDGQKVLDVYIDKNVFNEVPSAQNGIRRKNSCVGKAMSTMMCTTDGKEKDEMYIEHSV